MIKGVNIGGWLVLERYITPSQFALTKCHLEGDFCWYPSSISTPATTSFSSFEQSYWLNARDGHHEMKSSTSELKAMLQHQQQGLNEEQEEEEHPPYQLCSKQCTDYPVLLDNIFNATDYPLDEWNLAQVFRDFSTPQNGEDWLNVHFDKFVTYEDLKKVKDAGMTHVRVPLPHWILSNHPSATNYQEVYNSLEQEDGEPYLAGDRWKYFVRLCRWASTLQLQVWPNLHTAPGSQNSFDNSGHQGTKKTCQGWMDNTTTVDDYPKHVFQTLQILQHVTQQMVDDGISKVVTGFGLLNEPFINCDLTIYQRFIEDGLNVVRTTLGENTSIFVSDMFWAPQFNDGHWWLDHREHHNTYLDSHYYTVFTDVERRMTPSQHIDHVCHPPPQKGLAVSDCCWEDPKSSNTTSPSKGVQRIVTEFSAAFDSMPGEILKIILQSFREHGQAPPKNRVLSDNRKQFMKWYVQAQMIAFERAGGQGWFFWSLKMENDAYLEWDFLKGIEYGWFPQLVTSDNHTVVTSIELYGSCDDLSSRAASLNTSDVVHTYPWGDEASYQYWDPTGLGWKFDHEQQIKDNVGDQSVLTNVTVMMHHDGGQTKNHKSKSNRTTSIYSDKPSPPCFDNDQHPRHAAVGIWVWVQVFVVTLMCGLALKKLRKSLENRRRRHQYEPVKDRKNSWTERVSLDSTGNSDSGDEGYGSTPTMNV